MQKKIEDVEDKKIKRLIDKLRKIRHSKFEIQR